MKYVGIDLHKRFLVAVVEDERGRQLDGRSVRPRGLALYDASIVSCGSSLFRHAVDLGLARPVGGGLTNDRDRLSRDQGCQAMRSGAMALRVGRSFSASATKVSLGGLPAAPGRRRSNH